MTQPEHALVLERTVEAAPKKVYMALFMWGGLWLRDPALRAVFPSRRSL